jgi:Gram-negative bacterial TonB protein C-terminal
MVMRSLGAGWAIAVSLSGCLVAGCAHTPPPPSPAQPQPHSLGETGLIPPRLIEGSCALAPPDPKEAEAKHLSGVFWLDFVVRADGTADSIEPADAPAIFAESGKAWLSSCRFEPGTLAGKPVDVRSHKVIAFRNPPPLPLLMGDEPPPFDPLDVPASVTPPEPVACAPLHAPWDGQYPAEIDFTVHRDGRVSDVSVHEGPVEIPPRTKELLLAWLDTCPFTPARYEDKPVSVRTRIVNRFPRDYPWGEAVQAFRERTAKIAAPSLSADLTPPLPLDCKPGHPPYPEAARQRGVTGMVLAGYVVEPEGNVTHVSLYNPGVPWILFRTVREWLVACKFTPARDSDGRAVRARTIQPFTFKITD